MALRKHRSFNILYLIIFLLFLNGVCLAAQVLKSSVNEVPFETNSKFHTLEIMEESSLQISFKQSTDNQFSLRNHQPNRLFKRQIYTPLFEEILQKWAVVPYNSLLKPAYYNMLFRFTLF